MRPLHNLIRGAGVHLVSLLLVGLMACGGDGAPVSFESCGDGVIDTGEECDDGPGVAHGKDDDGCLSTCKLARCGDGFVNEAMEECDLTNLGNCGGDRGTFCSCKQLGFEGDRLRCNPGCTYDISACGPPLPPTPTRTATPLATATPTATTTPVGECGNGAREADETCDDGNTSDNDACPSDCRIRACTPSVTRVVADVALNAPAGALPRSATILLSYPDGVVGLPDGEERARLSARVGGLNMVLEADLQHAARVRLNRLQGLSGDVVGVSFDACEGAAAPASADFRCQVLACGDVAGCSCSLAVR